MKPRRALAAPTSLTPSAANMVPNVSVARSSIMPPDTSTPGSTAKLIAQAASTATTAHSDTLLARTAPATTNIAVIAKTWMSVGTSRTSASIHHHPARSPIVAAAPAPMPDRTIAARPAPMPAAMQAPAVAIATTPPTLAVAKPPTTPATVPATRSMGRATK